MPIAIDATFAERGAPAVAGGVLRLHLPALINEQDEPMRLLCSWLLTEDNEGPNFYAGAGGEPTTHPIPPGVRGYRLRRWPSEGIAPEYVDWMFEGEIAR